MSTEIYKRYRPTRFKEVVGQDASVKMLLSKVKKKTLPHSILLCGPSGVGKTTIARILKTKLHCGKADFQEINAADTNGIELVRTIRTRQWAKAMDGDSRIWLIDEAHELTSKAQNAFLKILEDTPDHVYFILATTDPQKLIPTVQNRCTKIALKRISDNILEKLLADVAKREKAKLGEEVLEKIVRHADGSARAALVVLEQVLEFDDEEEQLEAVERADVAVQSIALARAMINPRARWADVAKVLKGLDEDAERIRWGVLGYVSNVLLANPKLSVRAFKIIQAFENNFFDSKHAGLRAAAYEVVATK